MNLNLRTNKCFCQLCLSLVLGKKMQKMLPRRKCVDNAHGNLVQFVQIE